MKEKKRITLSLFRRKSNLLLFGILFFLAFFLLVFVSIYSASRKNIASIEKTYGTSFSIELVPNRSISEFWGEMNFIGQESPTWGYIGPNVDEELVSRIAEEVEGIIDYEAGSRELVMLHEYKLIPGYNTWSYEYFTTHEHNLSHDPEETKNMMYITYLWHLDNSYRYEQFYTGAFRLVEGRHITPEDTYKCIVSKAFAQQNDLTVGDTLKIDKPTLEVRSYPIESLGAVEVEIVGLYETTYQQVLTHYTEEEDILENCVITDNTTGYALKDLWGRLHGLAVSQFFVENPEEIDEIMKKVEKLDWIDWRCFQIVKDDIIYRNAVKPLRTMKTIMQVCLLLVLTAGILLLYLVVTHSMKKRIRETGILMSIGIDGKEIRKQFLLEHLLIGLAAFLLAFVVSFAVTPAIGSQIYGTINQEEEQKIYTNEEIEAAIARGEHSKVAEMSKNQKTGVEPLKEVETKVGVVTVLFTFVAMMLIIYWSVNAVIKKTMRLEPIRVLSMIT